MSASPWRSSEAESWAGAALRRRFRCCCARGVVQDADARARTVLRRRTRPPGSPGMLRRCSHFIRWGSTPSLVRVRDLIKESGPSSAGWSDGDLDVLTWRPCGGARTSCTAPPERAGARRGAFAWGQTLPESFGSCGDENGSGAKRPRYLRGGAVVRAARGAVRSHRWVSVCSTGELSTSAQFVDALELSWKPQQTGRYGDEPGDEPERVLSATAEKARRKRGHARTLWPFESEGQREPVVAGAYGVRGWRYQLECSRWLAGIAADGAPRPRVLVQLRAGVTWARRRAGCVRRRAGVGGVEPASLVGRQVAGAESVWRPV